MKLNPILDRVLVKMLETEDTTHSGIILTASSKDDSRFAQVIAVGPQGYYDGKEVDMCVTPGDKVLLNDYAGKKVKMNGEEYYMVKMSEILGIVED